MSTVHVVPLGDLVAHDVPGDPTAPLDLTGWWVREIDDDAADTGCPCGPTPECIPHDDGPDGWVVTHHALDHRELEETSR